MCGKFYGKDHKYLSYIQNSFTLHASVHFIVGRVSSVGIATRYGLDGPAIESRWGVRYSAPVQTDPGAHPATCTMGAGSLSRG